MNRSFLGGLLVALLPVCTTAIAQTPPKYEIVDLGSTTYAGQGIFFGDRTVESLSLFPGWPTLAPCSSRFRNVVLVPQYDHVALGTACAPGGEHAAIWRSSQDYSTVTITDVGLLPGALPDPFDGSYSSSAAGANQVGDVVGWSNSAYPSTYDSQRSAHHAFLWNNGKMTDLGSIAGHGYDSWAVGVNDSHEVVGTTNTISTVDGALKDRAFVYINGTLYNLTFYTTAGTPTALLTDALWIDCQGNIAAVGAPVNPNNGGTHSYLLVRQGPARSCTY
jgi:probable HAF family extracellular repeat protein